MSQDDTTPKRAIDAEILDTKSNDGEPAARHETPTKEGPAVTDVDVKDVTPGSAPKAPADSAPEAPADSAPEAPADSAPEAPAADSAPAAPADSAPEAPATDSAPEAPAAEKTEDAPEAADKTADDAKKKQGTPEALDFTCGTCGAVNRLPFSVVVRLPGSPACGRCNEPLLSHYSKELAEISPEAYVHPLDKETLEALKRIPGVSTMLRSLIKHSFELATRLHHHANFIRVSDGQLPKLWNLFTLAANRLGIPEDQRPELYVYQDHTPNAYTFGVEKSFVAISTGCLDLLDDEEVLCVLAHELGHVHADHVLYKSAARIFGSVASTIMQATLGIGGLVVYPIQIALMRWDRASELSCDRAALLVVKKPEVVLRTLMKIAGGTARMNDELNIDAFIKQADSFGDMQDEGPLGRYITVFQTLFRSHPFPIWRAKEILDWVATGNFLEILDGEYPRGDGGPKAAAQFADVVVEDPSADSGDVDVMTKTWRDVQSWYKRNFSTDDNEPPQK